MRTLPIFILLIVFAGSTGVLPPALAETVPTVDKRNARPSSTAYNAGANASVDTQRSKEPEQSKKAAGEDQEATKNSDNAKQEAEDTANGTRDEQNADKEVKKEEAEEDEKPDDEKKEEGEKKESRAEKKEKAKESERDTHKVESERFTIDVELDGMFAARDTQEIALRPEAWSDFKIEEIVEHGSRVHEGDVLVRFDDERINETIAALDLDLHLAELAIRRAEQELPRAEQVLQMELDDAKRTNKYAQEDYERYQEIDRPFAAKSANFMLKRAKFTLGYYQEELDQLEKMYAADDLTEETEEIVLKRQRDMLEFARFSVENAEMYRDEMLNISIPRADVRVRQSLDRAELALARAKMAMAIDLNRSRYELEKAKQTRQKALEKHAQLLGDRALMEIKATSDGIVYYGQCKHGNWSDLSSLINKLRPHGKASPNSVLMTIIQPRPLYVTATVDEEERPFVAAEQTAKITPPAEGSQAIAGTVSNVAVAPVGSQKFRVELDLDQQDEPDWLVAGMSCEIKVRSYDKADALIVPKKAVRTDDEGDKRYVWAVDPDDSKADAVRRDVEVGRQSGDQIEILKGIEEGDVISLDDEEKKKE